MTKSVFQKSRDTVPINAQTYARTYWTVAMYGLMNRPHLTG
jgi:hypothetical protein